MFYLLLLSKITTGTKIDKKNPPPSFFYVSVIISWCRRRWRASRSKRSAAADRRCVRTKRYIIMSKNPRTTFSRDTHIILYLQWNTQCLCIIYEVELNTVCVCGGGDLEWSPQQVQRRDINNDGDDDDDEDDDDDDDNMCNKKIVGELVPRRLSRHVDPRCVWRRPLRTVNPREVKYLYRNCLSRYTVTNKCIFCRENTGFNLFYCDLLWFPPRSENLFLSLKPADVARALGKNMTNDVSWLILDV